MTAQLLRFPKAKKRGAKVRTGPMARVLTFPAQLVGAELQRRWIWLRRNYDRWGNEELDGELEEVSGGWSYEQHYIIAQAAMGRLESGDDIGRADRAARADIQAWEACIRKRIRVKDWLEGLGIDWDDHKGSEAALFFAFDRLSGPTPPAAA
ncbi:hypothetical protein [Lysobacter sp. GCM10012299]|uniref:hypothetical protein n=1 Tax=Lysobacter sp. GCM10012299 TaxID=3317333 RepID=UPI003606C6D2